MGLMRADLSARYVQFQSRKTIVGNSPIANAKMRWSFKLVAKRVDVHRQSL